MNRVGIVIDPAAPDCPLCLKQFKRMSTPMGDHYVCHTDQIAIHVKDPFVGKWPEMEKQLTGEGDIAGIPCPACKERMRWFGTSSGYQKATCPNPRCKAAVEIGDEEEMNQRLQKDAKHVGGQPQQRRVIEP